MNTIDAHACAIQAVERKLSRYAMSWVLLSALLLMATLSSASADTQHGANFSLEQRVACQATIEDIRWAHRIWPKDNSTQKPLRSEILSNGQILERAKNSLAMEAALATLYGITIDDSLLQAELNRMAKQTRAPERLEEMFSALNNDPVAIAECIVRPSLVQKMFRTRYASDSRQHGELKKQAEYAVAADSPRALEQSGGQEKLVEYVRLSTKADQAAPSRTTNKQGMTRIYLDNDQYERKRDRLERRDAARAAHLTETHDAFIHNELLEHSSDKMKVRVLVWKKKGFDAWWQEQSSRWKNTFQPKAISHLELPSIQGNTRTWRTDAIGKVTADSWAQDLTYFPSERHDHVAVWTGSEMIIWGGTDNRDYLNSGGRYDPATDSWKPTSITGAPDGRQRTTAVWTGTEMIIWGGRTSAGVMGSGGRYNPASDSWTATTNDGAPGSRSNHTAVWTGSEMIVWGGSGSGVFADGGRYNPSTDSWTSLTTTGSPFARYLHTAVWTGSEMIVWGGSSYPTYFNDGGRYDPVADSWSPLSATGSPSGRYMHTAVWTGSKMLVWGGKYSSTLLDTGGRYDPGSDSWDTITTSNAPSARELHSAVWSGNRMLIWGGQNYPTSYDDGGSYDPLSDSWTTIATTGAPENRTWHTAIWSGSEMIVWGGLNDSSSQEYNSGGRYNPAADSWSATSIPQAPSHRTGSAAVWTGNELIVWGGYGDTLFNTGGRYDPATDSWTATSTIDAPEAREFETGEHANAVWTGTEMIIWGGWGSSSELNTGGRYNPATDSWLATSQVNAPNARSSHTILWTGDQMIIWGGYDGNDYVNDGGRYNPASDSWSAITMTGAPSTRSSPSAVWTGSEMIIWGGWDGSSQVNTGFRYNPSTDNWTPTDTSGAPDARGEHSAVWTGSEMIVWGGYSNAAGTTVNTGGRYDPSTDNWLPTSLIDAPSGRSSYPAIWTGQEMIVWGGLIYGSGGTNTGGRYDPATNSWLATSTLGAPIGRVSHHAVWTGEEMIVWGGRPYTYQAGIYYPYSSYTIGGTVSGLVSGNTVILQNNGGDDLPVNANGGFTFDKALFDNADYEVTVSVQPSSPDQSCVVSSGSGTVTGADVSDISITCTVNQLFADVAPGHWAYDWIQTLAINGITSGCGGGNYCPTAVVSRSSMAVFLERGIHGSDYVPPAATGSVFNDVSPSYWAAAWLEQLAADGVTGGCGGGNYCPEESVTRASMAVFLLRSMYGSAYVPPSATGTVFSDVPVGYWAAAWIEQLASEGITDGCGGGNYCPDSAVSRDQMAVFLVRAFNL